VWFLLLVNATTSMVLNRGGKKERGKPYKKKGGVTGRTRTAISWKQFFPGKYANRKEKRLGTKGEGFCASPGVRDKHGLNNYLPVLRG